MANAPIGTDFISGPLGVCRIEIDDIDMGKTNEDTEIELIEDITDIIYHQDGTQPYDKIPTGQAYQVTFTMAEITGARLEQLKIRGIDTEGSSIALKRDIYRSARDNFSVKLVLKRVDSDGNSWSDQHYWLTFYKAFCQVTSPVVYGSETQRSLQIQAYIFYDPDKGAFGYQGIASSVGLNPAA